MKEHILGQLKMKGGNVVTCQYCGHADMVILSDTTEDAILFMCEACGKVYVATREGGSASVREATKDEWFRYIKCSSIIH